MDDFLKMLIRKLASLKLAFFNLIFLAVVMGAGVGLSVVFPDDFKAMNEMLMADWLIFAADESRVLAVWFAVLCLSAVSLSVNLICCCFTKQVSVFLKQQQFKKWIFFGLHCCFILVLACHGLILITGAKQGNRTGFSGDILEFEGRYRIEISDVVYNDDKTVLQMDRQAQRAMMTRDGFRREQNWAQLSLYKGKTLLKTKKVYILSPLRHGPVQVTLTHFLLKNEDDRQTVGVNLTISRNFLNTVFFAVYAVMICLLGIYILLKPATGRSVAGF